MRLAVIFLFVLSLFGADFDWIHYQKGLELAKKSHKPIMIMISQPNCITCQYMDSVVFEDEKVVDFIEYNFIPIKLSLQEAKKYGFKAYGTPTFYFLKPNGERIGRAIAGGATAKEFLDKLKEIKSGL